jgi:hypothetical protein
MFLPILNPLSCPHVTNWQHPRFFAYFPAEQQPRLQSLPNG